MSRKLWILNLLLLAGLALIARELHGLWKSAREREKNELSRRVESAKAAPPMNLPAPPPVQAASYLDVAQQMLFSKDRNPTVVEEQKVEAPKPPPPPLPKFYGVMNLGDGPLAILSDAGRQRPFQTGEQVGEYKLMAIGADTLTLRWDGKDFVKKFSELQDRTGEPQVSEARVAAAAERTPPAPSAPPTPAAPGPGADMGGGLAACNPNDPSPAGTVVDGKRKVVTESPFGRICRWEPVR